PNSMGGGCPFQAKMSEGGFSSYAERIDAKKIRERSQSFFDHFSQAALFFTSQSEPEKNHMIDALRFELGKVEIVAIRERMLYILSQVDKGLAEEVAYGLGLSVPKSIDPPLNQSIPADGDPKRFQPIPVKGKPVPSPALSMANTPKGNIKTRKIAILVADGVNENNVAAMRKALTAAGAVAEIIAPRLGSVKGEGGQTVAIDKSLLTTASVFYDAVYVPSGKTNAGILANDPDAIHFLNQAYRHCKAIAADSAATPVLQRTYFADILPELVGNASKTGADKTLTNGILLNDKVNSLSKDFITAIGQHRFWEREKPRKVPA
ncbi:catalase-related domain-containing protein, partial [Flavitalea flava]